jgi:hypothetical protein
LNPSISISENQWTATVTLAEKTFDENCHLYSEAHNYKARGTLFVTASANGSPTDQVWPVVSHALSVLDDAQLNKVQL